MFFDIPVQNTNAISSKMEEQITIVSTISRRNRITNSNSTCKLLSESWKRSDSVNLLSVPEIEEIEKINTLIKFIQKNKLSESIITCEKHIKSFFSQARIEREVHYDFEEDYTKLFLIINTPLSVKDAFRQGRRMFKNWELVRNPAFNKHVSVTTKAMS